MRDRSKRRAAALLFVSTSLSWGCGGYGDEGGTGGSAGDSQGGSAGSGATNGGSASATGGASGSSVMSQASGCTMTEGGTDITGLCADAPLNALTQAEQLQLCNDTGAYVAQAIDRAIGCKYVAIVAAASNSSPTEAELQNACSARETACNQDDTIMGAGEQTLCSQIPATCTATVAQYAACVMDQAAVFEQSAAGLTACSALTFGNLSTVYDVPMAAANAAGCMAVKTACPGYSLPYIN